MYTKLPSYGKVWAFGVPQLGGLLEGNIVVQEKIDGSQFSFGKIDGEVKCSSHHQPLDLDHPNKMFTKAVEHVKSVADQLPEGIIFRGEFLEKPKHNALAYDRVPKNNIMLFDAQVVESDKFYDRTELTYIAELLRVEVVPELWRGPGSEFNRELFDKLLATVSVLGGQKIEGFVVKNFSKRERMEGTLLKGKYVSEAFKEVHAHTWNTSNPGQKDIVLKIMNTIGKDAYWNKAVQHVEESGKLQHAPQDIGPLLKELNVDVESELEEQMKEQLWKWAWPQVSRLLASGFPQWYKDKLAATQFDAKQEKQ